MALHETDTMRSINIQLTDKVLDWLDAFAPGGRSEGAREIIAAVMASGADGDHRAFDAAVAAAMRTTPDIRNAVAEAGHATWHKAIIWIPSRMEAAILERLHADSSGLRVSDFIRGTLFGAAGEDPASALSGSGHEFWAGAVEPSDRS